MRSLESPWGGLAFKTSGVYIYSPCSRDFAAAALGNSK